MILQTILHNRNKGGNNRNRTKLQMQIPNTNHAYHVKLQIRIQRTKASRPIGITKQKKILKMGKLCSLKLIYKTLHKINMLNIVDFQSIE